MKYIIIWFIFLPIFVALVPRVPLEALILSSSLVFGYFGVSLFRMRAAFRSSLKELEYHV